MTNKHVSPVDGGCWFCHTTTEPLEFCWEFDCYVHLDCIDEVLSNDPDQPEGKIMHREMENRA